MEVVSILGEMKGKMNFGETELRLGLPGNINSKVKNSTISHVTNSAAAATNVNGKRGFAETTNHVDLKLNLVSSKHVAGQILDQAVLDPVGHGAAGGSKDSVVKPPAKTQVVGWPPVRSYRKNMVCIQKAADSNKNKKGDLDSEKVIGGTFVKVSVDGAPYLRKVDLNMYNTYQQLSDALGKMFSSFTIGKCGSEGMMDFMNESKLMDLLNNSDYVPTYQDKDGDWMLVGDVPWDMFVGSCKRLRIMKGAEAIGLAPRAVEKCKNRT